MKHSATLENELLTEHHVRTPTEDGRVQYPPKTPDATLYWMHTGVCPGCQFRTISCGRCAECGWESLK